MNVDGNDGSLLSATVRRVSKEILKTFLPVIGVSANLRTEHSPNNTRRISTWVNSLGSLPYFSQTVAKHYNI